MLESGALYDPRMLPRECSTFVDLGCNVGYFTCWLAHVTKSRQIRGLMLDANPGAVKEARWHARANELSGVDAIHGIVGSGKPGELKDFYLYESNICSTAHPDRAVESGLKGQWKNIKVPCVAIGELWQERFGNARCNLLKVDVEGSELEFLKAERAFLGLCDSVLIEWHKWEASFEAVSAVLFAEGFRFVKTLDENPQMGTAYFARPDIAVGK